jgi:transcriptional regulator GlxA family with amidase domain
MHRVAVLALDGVVAFDLAVPAEVFSRLRRSDGTPAYRLRVCAPQREVDAGTFVVRTRWGLGELGRADTIIVPGTAEATQPVPLAVVRALQAAARRGARIASICSGAFVLAASGLLDGRRATTHWLAAAALARLYPRVTVDPDVLYVDAGQILTSAGAAAGLDLCLHLVRRDHGAAVAADAARLAVMPLERAGGQAQFIAHRAPASGERSDGYGASLEPLRRWLEEHLDRAHSLQAMARRAAMSIRTLNRRFREETGTTPLQWLLELRVRRAQQLLETSRQPLDSIAARVGFATTTTFRQRFRRVVGASPQAYRRAFNGDRARPRSRTSLA